MIDAYTIGITLALDNGVATGIAAIRQDLAALDRAVATSALGLLAMRRLSENPGFSAFAGPTILLPSAHPAPSPTVEDRDQPASSTPPPSASSAALLPSHSSLDITIPAAPSPASNSLSPSVTEHRTLPDSPAAPAGPFRPAAPVGLGSELKSASVSRPPGDTAPVSYSPSPPAAPMPVPSPQPFAFPPAAAATPASPAPITKPAAPAAARSASPQHGTMPAPRASAAPKAMTSQAAPTPRPDAHDNTENSPAAAQTQSNPMAAPSHGEIILDGARLGRWMSDRLARAASRPGSGTTAFDPRISALYPGAPSGF